MRRLIDENLITGKGTVCDTRKSFLQDLNTVFSFPVWETQIQWSVLAREYFKNVFVTTAEASAKPNSE